MTPEEKKAKNRELMPGVAELIDAHVAAFGSDFIVLRSIEYKFKRRITKKGITPYEYPSEAENLDLINHELAHALDEETKTLYST